MIQLVLRHLPPDRQSFLLETSVLSRLSGPLCDAVTEGGGGKAALERLERGNLFVADTHVNPDPTRTRRLLMHRLEIDRLTGLVERRGYTLVPLELYWNKGKAKLNVGLARGKKQHDKRASIKERDWKREQGRLLRDRG